jgi:hypothetical protein
MESLLPSSFAPAKRQRRKSPVNDNGTNLDIFLSQVSMREAPVKKWPKPAKETAKEPAKAPARAPGVVTVILINGFKVTESGENQEFIILKLFVRPQLRGKYVKLVRSEKQLAVEMVDAYLSAGHGLRAAIEQVKSVCTLFNTLCVSSYTRFQRQLKEPEQKERAAGNNSPSEDAALTQPSRKRGRPSTVTDDHRQCIKDKVSMCHMCAASSAGNCWPALLNSNIISAGKCYIRRSCSPATTHTRCNPVTLSL